MLLQSNPHFSLDKLREHLKLVDYLQEYTIIHLPFLFFSIFLISPIISWFHKIFPFSNSHTISKFLNFSFQKVVNFLLSSNNFFSIVSKFSLWKRQRYTKHIHSLGNRESNKWKIFSSQSGERGFEPGSFGVPAKYSIISAIETFSFVVLPIPIYPFSNPSFVSKYTCVPPTFSESHPPPPPKKRTACWSTGTRNTPQYTRTTYVLQHSPVYRASESQTPHFNRAPHTF